MKSNQSVDSVFFFEIQGNFFNKEIEMEDYLIMFNNTIEFLKKNNLKYEYMKFSSGSIMLDVWFNKKFYVFQFEPNQIGFSEVDENVGFDAIPDKIILNSDILRLVLTSLV
ncbi:hypothetical protein [Sphingobacterium siyangense]